MDIIKTPILEGITPEEQEQMRVCFGVREEAFRAGEDVYKRQRLSCARAQTSFTVILFTGFSFSSFRKDCLSTICV